jgi:putative chitinase
MTLKIGSTGEEVKKLQSKLGLTADGSFGPKTAEAVKAWQTLNGLTADGIVGDGTWSKMFTESSTPVTSAPVSSTPLQAGALKLEKLRGHIPDSVLAQIPDTAAKFNISTNLRLAHFLAQCGHESGGFKAVSENLNYSETGLVKVFRKYFTEASAPSYAKRPEKIANRVYADRMGNGNEGSGDGWKFRGRGYIQLTGKSNYQSFDAIVEENVVENPDLVATKYPLASAAFFFNKNGLWSICDKGFSEDIVTQVTKRVNGGTIGLEDRIKHFKEYYALLTK